ncbi:unnamed protein product [Schistosoma rodhaini]|nr:unnamed protein product [Schistosoma rodhaini]
MRYLFQQNGLKVVHWWSLKSSENTSTGTTEENKPHKSYWYLYVVIPLATSLFLICIGYIIWRWLLRRKKSGK